MTQPTGIQSTIAANNENFMAAFKSGDAVGLADLYTSEAQLLPPNGDFVTGKKEIETFWKGVMDMGIKSADMVIQEVEEHGDTAIEVSKFKLRGQEGQVLDEGKYIVIWKEEDGHWKLHRDIFNSSLPAA